MNDPQFVEASKVLATRMIAEGGKNIEDQIAYGFRLAVSRKPKTEESKIFKELFESQAERFDENPQEAVELLSVGKKEIAKSYDQTQVAALTMVANTMLNHDEAYMKR